MDDRQKKVYQEMLKLNDLSPEGKKALEQELERIFAVPGAEEALAQAQKISTQMGIELYVYPDPKKEKTFIAMDVLPQDPGITRCWAVTPDGRLIAMEKQGDHSLN